MATGMCVHMAAGGRLQATNDDLDQLITAF
jgi:hypothetical protein